MNILIISRQGVLDTPILVKNDVTAQAVFDELANDLAGEDVSEVSLHFDSQLDDLNRLISYKGIEVFWFVDVDVNKYKN